MKKIVIYWKGFPVCGTRIASLTHAYEVSLYVSEPMYPVEDFAALSSISVHDVNDTSDEIILNDISNADLLIYTSWASRRWRYIAQRAREINPNLKSCISVDNNLRFTLRQLVASLFFKYWFPKFSDFFIVPGYSTLRLLNFFGVEGARIYSGYYGHTTSIFFDKPEISKHGFLFVGQKINRKGIDTLRKAFNLYQSLGGVQPLWMVGGETVGKVEELRSTGISETGFLNAHDTAQLMQNARTFILPSRLEHWGTVVSESAACGCTLILSDCVGALPDLLLNGINGFSTSPGSAKDLAIAMLKMDDLPISWHANGRKVSVSRAMAFSDANYLHAIDAMLDCNPDITKQKNIDFNR